MSQYARGKQAPRQASAILKKAPWHIQPLALSVKEQGPSLYRGKARVLDT